ncbi:MAG: MBL fold metallo-hydrolase [Bacteroidetes bacterium]|nr:MBL fold metallo-hydrolase [Bacteroidota bacterium]
MKITFLGTGTSQGVPVIGCRCEVCQSLDFRDKRLRVSVLIQTEHTTLVIDTGPDFRQQMLRERVSRLDGILLTHSHKDHIAGLDDVRAFNFLQEKGMPIFGKPETLEQVRKEFYYAFEEKKYPGTPELTLHDIDSDVFEVNGIKITPLPVMHMRMPVLGFRIGDFSYITDANFISDDTLKKISGSRILVLNALQREKHLSHFNLHEALEQAKIIGAEQTYFTHVSHKMGLHHAVSKELPESVSFAYDGLAITL